MGTKRVADMSTVYMNMSEYDLRKLRSKKYLRLTRIQNSQGWFDKKETATLKSHMHQIDVEIACRVAQQSMW